MSDLEKALLAWTRAKLRFAEFTMAQVGSAQWQRLLPERGKRFAAVKAAEVDLLRLGNRLLDVETPP